MNDVDRDALRAAAENALALDRSRLATTKRLAGLVRPLLDALTAAEKDRDDNREAYQAWRADGLVAHEVLLNLWRRVVPDSDDLTFGNDPREVQGPVLAALRARPTLDREKIADQIVSAIDDKGIRGRLYREDCNYLADAILAAVGQDTPAAEQ